METGSKEVAKAALAMAMTSSREEERLLKEDLKNLPVTPSLSISNG